MEKVYVFGHRNPDTDSVTAAIALSHLKKELGVNAVPAVLSGINLETKYVLKYFGVKEPIFLNDVKIKVKDLNYTKNYSVTEQDSINDAYHKMNEAGISKIPMVDDHKKLLGIITMKDIAKEQFNENIDLVDSTYDNILEAIDGKELLRFNEDIKGKLTVASYRSKTIISSVPLDTNSILMVGDRHSVIEYAIASGIKLLIMTGGHQIKEEHLKLAKEKNVNIIVTPYPTLIAARRINLANSVSTINYVKDILCISEYENVSDFMGIANKTRYSYYPVIDENEKCKGILRMSDVSYDNRKNVILVDHNSYEQSAIGLEETNIVEIVDHHNIGSIGTNMPINFRNMPVGSTNTIIYTMFRDNNIEIPSDIAGIMLSGIISDTLLFKSPTTTNMDIDAAIVLSHIAKVNYNEYGMAMLKAGSTLKGRTKEEILYTDYKSYPVNDKKIGLSQIFTMNIDEVLEEVEDYVNLMNDICKKSNYYFICLFVTDIINNGSYVIYSDNAKDIIKESFNLSSIYQGIFIKDILSRKKQVVPIIMNYMENN